MSDASSRSKTDLCEPGMHKWMLGERAGEYCSRCGWSRAEYELKTKDLSRDSLRRYSVAQPAASPVVEDASDTERDP